VVRTRVGYAGGTKENPTYRSLGDHSETIQIDYDPTVISYEELLDVFWNSHRPTRPAWSRQYMSIVFYHNEEQRKLALESKAHQEARLQHKVYTEIVPASGFYLAEDYHQKYRLQQSPQLVKEFRKIYPNIDGFVASTAVARVNGYVGGHATLERLQAELNDLGLSPKGQEVLVGIVSRFEQ